MTKGGFLYILECNDGSYYVGCTSNLEQRLAEHHAGKFKGYTFSRRPLKLMFVQEFPTIDEAIQSERKLKNWSRAKKKALIDGDFQLLVWLSRSKKSYMSKKKNVDRDTTED